jgi:hypothetical protein
MSTFAAKLLRYFAPTLTKIREFTKRNTRSIGMDIITNDDLLVLAAHDEAPCVTMLLPAADGQPEERDRARLHLKNMLRDVRERLRTDGWRVPDIDDLLAPAAEKLGEPDFWRVSGTSLAFFLAPGLHRIYHLPQMVEPRVMVAPRFHIRPLLAYAENNARFYVLALSQKQVRLFLADRYEGREVGLEGVPTSIAEALAFEDPERQLQSHVTVPSPRGGGAMVFHGHAPTEEEKDRLLRYCREIDVPLRRHLRLDGAPLVLAGVAVLQTFFRQVSGYSHVLDRGLMGNRDHQSAHDLQQEAWPLVYDYLQEARQAARDRYRSLLGSERATSRLVDILMAAHTGRIDTLFVPCREMRWGAFDLARQKVTLHDEPQGEGIELIDLAAIQTLLHAGTVYAADDGEAEEPLAAILRY